MNLDEVKAISISEYLSSRGIPNNPPQGNKTFFKSPFTSDTSYSLCVYYDTNSFYDWSQGFGGSILDLVMAMDGVSLTDAVNVLSNGDYSKYTRNYKEVKTRVYKHFEYTKFLTTDKTEIMRIREYAESRNIFNGYECGVYHTLDNGEWVRHPALMFLHRDDQNKVCGAKFRRIINENPRFSARGRMAFYILEYADEHNFGPSTLYVVEGEANANSLWEYLKQIRQNCVVVSFGGVGNLPKSLPEKYNNIKERKLIIDFDGDEELYNKRLELYDGFNLTPVKMILPKGQDINYLFQNNKMKLIDKLI